MLKTTTNNIELLESGILLSKMKTRSGFKKVYVIEQANVIFHEYKGEKKRLIVDITKVGKSTLEEVKNLICEETENISSAVAIILKSKIRRATLNLYWSLKKKSTSFEVKSFSNLACATAWLSTIK